jgi:hypothetical protein
VIDPEQADLSDADQRLAVTEQIICDAGLGNED